MQLKTLTMCKKTSNLVADGFPKLQMSPPICFGIFPRFFALDATTLADVSHSVMFFRRHTPDKTDVQLCNCIFTNICKCALKTFHIYIYALIELDIKDRIMIHPSGSQSSKTNHMLLIYQILTYFSALAYHIIQTRYT